jgi:hypothetical protein
MNGGHGEGKIGRRPMIRQGRKNQSRFDDFFSPGDAVSSEDASG